MLLLILSGVVIYSISVTLSAYFCENGYHPYQISGILLPHLLTIVEKKEEEDKDKRMCQIWKLFPLYVKILFNNTSLFFLNNAALFFAKKYDILNFSSATY
ncbi:uncharacterized protein BX663DRAFT_495665 [Cokeromyces recurvatus]|uniref:uncharacterized protein n=1 Tax=Cokeromyces recurvatus TaxID=90255 RepID=UPI00221F808C|nr:uncharacterized protein BX663DRAFT_495665 [Cokeromyces recurvatus]KAI7907365.1 hypothetical protein BX663DRAFT_495665 [Cokeromyces recurvatus]